MQKITQSHAKLFLTAGAFLSVASLVIGAIAAFPNAKPGESAAAVTLKDTTMVLDVPTAEDANSSSTRLSIASHASLLAPGAPQSGERMIIADLAQKYITVVDATTTIAKFPILSVGREGTFWETPSGDYSIRTKEISHRSSIGGTWMPWSMQFYGNFFIHGWPTHDDGSPVPKGYSGGCIRLDTLDAEKLYSLVDLGVRVHVRGAGLVKDPGAQYFLDGSEALPEISASGFLVTDISSGKVLWSRGLEQHVRPGRLASLMTALVSAETIDQYKWIDYEQFIKGGDVTRADMTSPSAVQIGALMYPLLYDGSNIAAEGIASFRGAKQFRKYMNEKSLAIGMKDTTWGGASSEEVSTSTVQDLGRMISYIDLQKSFLMRESLTEEHSFGRNGVKRFTWKNTEPLLSDATYRGGLVARDEIGTGDAMVVFSLKLGEFTSRRIGVVVVDAKNIDDTLAVIKNTIQDRFVYRDADVDEKKIVAEN